MTSSYCINKENLKVIGALISRLYRSKNIFDAIKDLVAYFINLLVFKP